MGQELLKGDYIPADGQTIPVDMQMHDAEPPNLPWQYNRLEGPDKGILQSDGYGAYDHVGGTGIVHAACWAHAKRKFFDALKINPKDQSSIGIVAQMDEFLLSMAKHGSKV